ncbi:hypothetical protein BU15DRAFT_63993 [Melanogaster broomeanus]|nr:hypothetical protein BU15DRAFT_63993 [Melanogaster broomeanus]
MAELVSEFEIETLFFSQEMDNHDDMLDPSVVTCVTWYQATDKSWRDGATTPSVPTHCVVHHYISSQMSKTPTEKASWNTKEVEELVNYKAGDGSNFKAVTFNAAAEHLAQFWTAGAAKTGQSVKNKWATSGMAQVNPWVQVMYLHPYPLVYPHLHQGYGYM